MDRFESFLASTESLVDATGIRIVSQHGKTIDSDASNNESDEASGMTPASRIAPLVFGAMGTLFGLLSI